MVALYHADTGGRCLSLHENRSGDEASVSQERSSAGRASVHYRASLSPSGEYPAGTEEERHCSSLGYDKESVGKAGPSDGITDQ